MDDCPSAILETTPAGNISLRFGNESTDETETQRSANRHEARTLRADKPKSMRLSGLGAPIDTIASAIQTQEGYYPGSVSYRNNNPGNLVASSWTQQQPGYTGQDASGFAIFDSYANGQAAMDALIQNYAARGFTIQQMMAAWAPASQAGNNPGLYAQNVATAAGTTPDASLADLLAGNASGSVDSSENPIPGGVLGDGSVDTADYSWVPWAMAGAVGLVLVLNG